MDAAKGDAMWRQVMNSEPSGRSDDGGFLDLTKAHVFGEVWSRPELSVRDRRLVLIGMAAASGLEDVAGLQLDAALKLGELDADDLRTLVVFLAHYAGWPRAARLNTEVEQIISRHEKNQ